MDNDILLALNDIKFAIYILIGIVSLSFIVNSIRAGISLKNLLSKELNDDFNRQGWELFEEGNLNELISFCENKLKNKPNHTYALWYKAKAHYQKNEYALAKELFELLGETEPSWNESHVQPYLQKINEASNTNR